MLTETIVWQEAERMAAVVEATTDTCRTVVGEMESIVMRPQVRRIVVTGNGASLHAGLAMWQLARGGPARLPVEWVYAGHLANGAVALDDGDLLIAVSTSGELRDLVEVLGSKDKPTTVTLSAHPDSPVATAADLFIPLTVETQHAVTHTQAYVSAVTAGLFLAGWLRHDLDEHRVLQHAAEWVSAATARAATSAPAAVEALPRPLAGAMTVGSGAAWPAALQAGLMFKELAELPTESAEAREALTSSRFTVHAEHLVLLLGRERDTILEEATESFRRTEATVATLVSDCPTELLSLALFPQALAMAVCLAQRRGLDPDHPSWFGEYLRLARADS